MSTRYEIVELVLEFIDGPSYMFYCNELITNYTERLFFTI